MSEEITHQFPPNGYEIILVRLDSLDSRMTGLEEKVERKMMETRPIWEQVMQQVIHLDSRFDDVDKRFDAFEKRFEQIDERFEQIDERFEQIDQRFEHIEQRFDAVDGRFELVDQHFDAVDRRFNAMDLRLDGIETSLGAVENRLGKVEREVYHLGKKFRVFEQEILDVKNAGEDLDERVTKLEEQT